jgi:hypothetical protein
MRGKTKAICSVCAGEVIRVYVPYATWHHVKLNALHYPNVRSGSGSTDSVPADN